MSNLKQVLCQSLGLHKKQNAKIKVSVAIALNTCFSWRCALVTETNDYARSREPRINAAQRGRVCAVCDHLHTSAAEEYLEEAAGSIVSPGASPEVPVRPLPVNEP